jgi:pyruvate dehydrogenase E2 component (dihydrolipoamide acetyltransferase)
MSEIKTLEMPKWGLSMEEGLLARWAIQEGDASPEGRKSVRLKPVKSSMCWRPPLPVRYVGYAREGDTLQVGAVLALALTLRSAMLNWTNLLPVWRGETRSPWHGGCRAGCSGRGALRCFAPANKPAASVGQTDPRQSARRDRCDSGECHSPCVTTVCPLGR